MTDDDGSTIRVQIDSVSIQTQSHSSNTLNTMGPFCDYPESSKASDSERYMTSAVHQTRPLDDWTTATRGIALRFIGEAELDFGCKRALKVQFCLPKRGESGSWPFWRQCLHSVLSWDVFRFWTECACSCVSGKKLIAEPLLKIPKALITLVLESIMISLVL